MSYSFTVKAADKEAAKAAVAEKFDESVVANQAAHARDRSAVLANANAVIDLLSADETKDVMVSVNGYVSWPNAAPEDPAFNTVAVCASASHANRMPIV